MGQSLKQLILGGARSGKSRYAEQLAKDSGQEVVYIATANAVDSIDDSEMRNRIALHQQQRPKQWLLAEEPIYLADTLQRYAAPNRCILVDCLTLWLSNLLFFQEALDSDSRIEPSFDNDTSASESESLDVISNAAEALFTEQRQQLLATLADLPGTIIFVSNEVGQGIIPLGATTRRFVDEAGWLHQALAPLCDRVFLVAAGLPLALK